MASTWQVFESSFDDTTVERRAMHGRTPLVSDRCPLCRESKRTPIWRVSFSEIWRALRHDYGAAFSAEVVNRHTPTESTTLSSCARCGLQYFAPAVAGDSSFYGDLMRGAKYEADRWEFGVVARDIRRGESVLDIGCGEGAFMRRIASSAGGVVGLDQNKAAAEKLQEMGFDVYAQDAASFAAREEQRFDVVTAFHTFEHLPDVAGVVEPAERCLKPEGRLFVSVPNRNRYGRPEFEPLDCPPHHLSRWDAEQFTTLAHRFGLTLVSTTFEEPDRSHADLWRIDRARRLGAKIGGAVVGDLFAGAYSRIGCSRATLASKRYALAARRKSFTRRGICGMTMLAEFRLPAP